MKICTCNNCGGIFKDINPDTEKSIEYPDINSLLELERGEDEDGAFIGCPICHSDRYLIDNINEGAMDTQQIRNLPQELKEFLMLPKEK